MTQFSVPEMSCGHCTAAIEKAVKAVDADAKVDCDLKDRTVRIDSALPPEALKSAIAEAGYAAA
ncbi:heavy-metal-associated domain-containing protein [Tropicimonas isoalkanivorans]|uniref:Copper chaperone n=1 Tax=Tropicimonas isoalkanivorans TaxID=441112 RepID=A0A1I1NNN9_9RHOB|nr:heavy-metal-associated domain-containing protein [Tropicimonas isoalkanivorans]SFC99271.1 copper chaperone [Tropicimonas isoalkanivorans]